MTTHDDNQTAPADALAPALPMTSADRARLWAAMNVSRRSADDHE